MKLLYYGILLASGLVAIPSQAQQPAATVAATDTAGYMKGGYHKFLDRFYFGTLTKTDGTEIHAYLPSQRIGYERIIDYFLTPPGRGEWNHRHTLKMKKIRSMAVHGRVYETVQRRGKNTKIMALHLLDGPISLSTYAEPRSIPVPIPLMAGAAIPILAIPISNKNHWYLRRNGVCTEITRAHFAQLMSAYLFDNPELAAKVTRQQPGYQHRDTPAILAEYNRAKSNSSGQ
ncbi:MAG: hypothetical protein ACRYFX_23295 [Janthinobacterium lividum]